MLKTFTSGVDLIRVMIPPWNRHHLQIMKYEIRPQKRVRQPSWTRIRSLGWFLLILYLAWVLIRDEPLSTIQYEIIPVILGIIIFILGIIVIGGHGSLMQEVGGRAAQAIAGRRVRGDWDLIAITPLAKERWLQAQAAAIGWQMFPLIRRMIVCKAILVFMLFSYLLVVQIEQYPYISPLLYLISMIPFGVLLIFFPVIELGLSAQIALLSSSYSKQMFTVPMIYSLVGGCISRILITGILVGGFSLVYMLLILIVISLGSNENDIALNSDTLFIFTLCCCGGILMSAAFAEWLPAIVPIGMIGVDYDSGWIVTYLILSLGVMIAYVIAPPLLAKWINRRTAKRLDRRE